METSGICATPFWNQSVSWDTKDPYFSECFKHLILVVGSCAVLWIVAPLEFVKICKYQGTPSPWTKLSIAKIIFKILLLIICVIELVKEIYAYVNHIKYGLDGLIAAVAYFVTIVLTVILTMMCKSRGLRSSLALPSFWMISTITTIISLYDDIHSLDWNDWVSSISLIDDSVVFVISVIQLILSSMSENDSVIPGRQFVKHCPLDGRSLPSRLTYSWMLSLFAKSAANTLHQDHLIPECDELRSSPVSRSFNKIWRREISGNEYLPAESTRLLESEEISFRDESKTSSEPKTSLFTVLMKSSKKYFVISSIIEILYTALYFLPTYLLRLILGCDKEEEWHKYLYATALFFSMLLCTFANSQRQYYGLFAAIRIKTALMNAIFEKALVSQKLQDVQTYMQEDAENIFQMVCLASEVWGAPIRLLIGLYLLWFFLGSASFIGIATAAFLIPLNTLLENVANHFENKSLTVKNERLNVLKEVLHGMKLVKIYAWEDFFLQKLMSLRKSEIRIFRKAVLIRIASKLLTLSSTLLVGLATFTVFVLMGNFVDVKTIFIAMYLIYLLKTPFSSLLRLLSYFIQGLTSLSHLRNFLHENKTRSLFEPNSDSEYIISLSNATFTWTETEVPCLKNLNLKVRDSTLIAVVGEPHSGKSSLLRALLGQMQNVDGCANVKGNIAFVSDNPWIQNTTLAKNILFLKPKVNLTYRKSLEACDLTGDINFLPEGDETEIGEKGYQLNEDQKLKVDLARAVYQNADIYLLDEPFRCAESAEHLYQRVIGRSGILKNKIRIFTTTDTTFLPLVDQILFVKNGFIVEQGNYPELLEKNGYLSQYVEALLNAKSSSKKNRKNVSRMKNEVSVAENFKDHCDPWYFASGMSLKPNAESGIHCAATDESKGLFRNLLKYVKMNGYCLTMLSILAASVACCCEVASWILWTKWTPKFNEEQKIDKNLYVYIGFIIAQVLCTGLCGIFIFIGSTLAVGKLYSWLSNRILRAPQSTFGTTFVTKVSQSLNTDLQYADENVPMAFFVWLVAVIRAPVLLFVIYFESPILCVFSIPLVLLYFGILKLYLKTWKQLHHLTAATRCPLTNLLKEALHGISNIRAYDASAHYITRFQMKLDTHNNCYFLFLLVSRWLSCSTEIIGSIFVFLTTLTIFIEKGHESNFVGLVIVFAMQIAESLIALTYMWSLLDVDLRALERLCSFSAIKQESEWENPSSEISPLWPTSGLISIQNLSTTYGETLYPVLNNINITVQPKEKIAVFGKEGSGIYTILDSLCRIREISSEQIFIDDIDISTIGLHDVRSRLAFVPREPLIFNGTLRENLDPKQKFEDDELWDSIILSELNFHFTDLNQVIGDDISLEYKNRISFARCLLKNPKIVIFEAPENSTKDGKTLFPNCTLLAFTESDVLDNYDRIIRISSGELVELFPQTTTSHD